MMKNQKKPHGENVIPAGYKRTEVGVIPNDWDEINLNSIVSGLEAGVSVNSIDQIDAYSHGKHILKTSCVSNGHFDGYEKKSILPTDVKRAKCSPVKGGIIVSRMNTPALVGEVGYVAESDLDSFLPDRLWQMKFKKDVAHNPKWLATLLSFPPFSKKIKDTATGTSGSMKNISKSAFLSLKLPWPSLKEQNIIGTALSDADALITALGQLIAKKNAIKNATMQQLLTGRTRLPHFSENPDGSLKRYINSELGMIPEDWEVKPFGELFESLPHRRTLRKEDIVSFVGMQDVSENAQLIKQTQLSFSEVRSGFTYFERGDVLVAKITPCFENGKGCHTDSLLTDVGFGSTEFHVLRAKSSSYSKFIYYWTINNNLRTVLESEMVGSAGHRRVPFSAIQNYLIPCPNTKLEQKAIATILSDMDAELEALEQKLAKFRDIKQGMMQQLLTGRIRLPVDYQP